MTLTRQQWIMVIGGVVGFFILVIAGFAIRNAMVGGGSNVSLSEFKASERVVGSASSACADEQYPEGCQASMVNKEARKHGNVSLCAVLEDKAYVSCVGLVARDTRRLEDCKSLDGEDKRSCRDNVLNLQARDSSNLELCDRIEDQFISDNCRNAVIGEIVRGGNCEEAGLDESLCEDQDLINKAIQNADDSLCDTLSESDQDNCYVGVFEALSEDTDLDGLSLQDERELVTDPSRVDSDNDGLHDGEEVYEHGTDPLLQDTDGDGFSDGEEVDAGYSPTEAG